MGLSYTDNYLKWIRENTFESKICDNTYRLTFPFLDSNNTMTELYIIEKQDKFIVTDDGFTFSELELINFDFQSKKRDSLIKKIISNYGVSKDENNCLFVECTKENLAFKKHLLIQCMLKISDLSNLSRSNVKTLFNEEVEKFFFDNDIRAAKDLIFNGKSKLQSNYDFCIGRTKRAPERIIKLINSVDSQQVRSVIFSWEDIKENRDEDSKLITIVNDVNRKISDDNINALSEYNIATMLWSKRKEYIKDLTA